MWHTLTSCSERGAIHVAESVSAKHLENRSCESDQGRHAKRVESCELHPAAVEGSVASDAVVVEARLGTQGQNNG